jgi:DNA-binding transcriptional LysR family regulator
MYSPVESRYFAELVTDMNARSGARPRYVQHVSQIHTMLALVEAGFGVAVVPETAAAMHPEGVTFRALHPERSPASELVAIWRADNENPVLARVQELLPPEPAGPASP